MNKPLCMTLWWMVIFLLSCNQRVEGCLDIEATNFDFEAEKEANDLCTYPDLVLNVLYSWGAESYVPGDTYTNAFNQSFIIDDFYVLLSQFVVNMTETGPLKVRETFDWYLEDRDDAIASDDFTFIDRSVFTFELGTINRSGPVDAYQLWVGVPDTLTPTRLDTLPESSSIRDARTVYDGDLHQFASARFIMNRDTGSGLLDTFVVFSEPVVFAEPLMKEYTRGSKDTIKIAIDLAMIFADVDLTLPQATIVEQLAKNINTSISDNH